jgi:hypothetical protein
MLFVRWQGLRTQLNMCYPIESRGGFRLFAGGIEGGNTIDRARLAYGGEAPDGNFASDQALLLGMGSNGLSGFNPRSLETIITGICGYANIGLSRGRAANSENRSTWTQNLLHALFKTLNIRDRQSHARRLCRIKP